MIVYTSHTSNMPYFRFLEACKDKCGPRQKEIYPYIIQECTPILCELGIETPEELGYDKPELALESVFEQWFNTEIIYFTIKMFRIPLQLGCL